MQDTQVTKSLDKLPMSTIPNIFIHILGTGHMNHFMIFRYLIHVCKYILCSFGLMLFVIVNSYGHVETVSSPNPTFSWESFFRSSLIWVRCLYRPFWQATSGRNFRIFTIVHEILVLIYLNRMLRCDRLKHNLSCKKGCCQLQAKVCAQSTG